MTRFLRPDPAPIPPGGLAAAVRGGRRRRTVFTLSGSAVTVGAVLAGVALAGAPAQRQSLEPAATPDSPTARPASPSPSPWTSPSPAPSGRSGETTGSRGGTANLPGSSPGVVPPPPARYPHHTAMRTGMEVGRPKGFQGATGTTQGWFYEGFVTPRDRATPGLPATTYDLRFRMCLLTPDGHPPTPKRTDFASELEVDFLVEDRSGKAAWRWSRGQSFARTAHSRTAPAGHCLWWETEWYGVADDGLPLRPGTYLVRMYHTPNGTRDGDSATELPVTIG